MKLLTFEDKPTNRIVRAKVPFGVRPELVISIHPGGYIELRELGRRKSFTLDAGALYVRAINNEARANQAAKAKKRKR